MGLIVLCTFGCSSIKEWSDQDLNSIFVEILKAEDLLGEGRKCISENSEIYFEAYLYKNQRNDITVDGSILLETFEIDSNVQWKSEDIKALEKWESLDEKEPQYMRSGYCSFLYCSFSEIYLDNSRTEAYIQITKNGVAGETYGYQLEFNQYLKKWEIQSKEYISRAF